MNWIEMLHVGLATALHKFRDGCSGSLEVATLEERLRGLSGKRAKLGTTAVYEGVPDCKSPRFFRGFLSSLVI